MKRFLLAVFFIGFAIYALGQGVVKLYPSFDGILIEGQSGNARSGNYLQIGNNNGVDNISVVKFDVSNIPSGSIIQKAELKLDFYSGDYNTFVINAHRITSSWTTSGLGYDNLRYNSSGIKLSLDFDCDIKDYVKGWIDGDFNNYGVALIGNTNDYLKIFYSSEYSTTSRRPYLEVTYLEVSDFEITSPTSETVWSEDMENAPIRWENGGLDDCDVTIRTNKGDIITNSTANDGTYNWDIIDDDINPDNDFKIYITTTAGCDLELSATSETFEIAPILENIDIIEPALGDVWETDKEQTITWNTGDVTSNIKIELRRGTSSSVITESTPNTGSFTFIPENIENGTYYIVLIPLDNNFDEVYSGNFTIASSTNFTISLNPNIESELINLSWEPNNVGNVFIDVYDSANNLIKNLTSNYTNTGSFTWADFSGLDWDASYKLKIYTDDNTISGWSSEFVLNTLFAGPNIELMLHSITDTNDNPKTTFQAGETVRITMQATNTGTSIPVECVLNIYDDITQDPIYDSHAQGIVNNTDSPLETDETDSYSFDWEIPEGTSGSLSIGAAIRNGDNFDEVLDETADGANTTGFQYGWILENRFNILANDGVELEVPYYNQDGSEWCWATSASMILGYYGYRIKPWMIASDLGKGKGEGLDMLFEFQKLVSYLNENFDPSENNPWKYEAFFSENNLKNKIIDILNDGYPVYLSTQAEEKAYHAIVVHGYDNNGFYVNDPSFYFCENIAQYVSNVDFDKILESLYSRIIYNTDLSKKPRSLSFDILPGGLLFLNNFGGTPNYLRLEWNGADNEYGYEFESESVWHNASEYDFKLNTTQADLLVIQPNVNSILDNEQCRMKIEIINDQFETVYENISSFMSVSKDSFKSYRLLPNIDKIELYKFENGKYTLSCSLYDSNNRFVDFTNTEFYIDESDYAAFELTNVPEEEKEIVGNDLVVPIALINEGTQTDRFTIKCTVGSKVIEKEISLDSNESGESEIQIALNDLEEGSNTVNIDISSTNDILKTKNISFNIDGIDNTLPTPIYNSKESVWYNVNSFLNIDCWDNTGLLTVQYQINSNDDSNPSDWHNLTTDGNNEITEFSGISFTDDWKISNTDWDALGISASNKGWQYIYFKVSDSEGNVYVTPNQDEAFCFGKDVHAPTCTVNVPETGQVLNEQDVDINWYAGDLVVGLELSGINEVFYALDQNTNFTLAEPNQHWATFENLDEGLHTFYMYATDNAGNTSQVVSRTFEINTSINPPEKFSLVSPTNNATITSQTPTFNWGTSTDPDGTDVSYDLYYSYSPDFDNVQIISGIRSASYQITNPLDDNEKVYWKVKAIDESSSVRWSNEVDWRFTIETANYYYVTFRDWDGTRLKTDTVAGGGAAIPPVNPTREGYIFSGWGVNLSNVTSNLTVTAQYQSNFYTLTDDDVVVTNGVIESCSYDFAIKNIIIPDTLDGQAVIGIGDDYSNIFHSKGIASVQLPSTIQTIGYLAFEANNLNEITIPNSVISIGTRAFSNNNLASVILPNSVTSIGSRAFARNSLISIDIPNSVTSIGAGAFNNNQIIEYNGTTSSGIVYARNTDGSEDITKIVSYGGVASIIDFIPNTVSFIGNLAFLENGLKGLTIPSSVTSIGDLAFSSNALRELTIPSSVTSIGGYAFFNNILLTSITFETNSNILTIEQNAFSSLSAITSISLPINANSNFIEYKDENGNIYAPGDVITDFTLAYRAVISYIVTFNNWDGTELLKDSVEHGSAAAAPVDPIRADYTFTGWDTDFSTVTSNLIVTAQYQSNYYTLTDEDVVVINGVIESCSYDFAIKNIIIPDTLDGQTITGLGEEVFAGKYITDVLLPSGLLSIGDFAFQYNNLSSITIPNSVTTIGAHAFIWNQISSIIIPNSVTTIGESAFQSNSITDVTISNSVTSFGNSVFNNNQIVSVNGASSNGIFYARNEDGAEDFTKIVSYGGAATVIDFIPNTVKTIGYSSFAFSLNITTVIIPNSVTMIEREAFRTNDITSISIPASVISIGTWAFVFNELSNVSFEANSNIVYIGRGAFSRNDNLTSINLPTNANPGFVNYFDNSFNTFNPGETLTDLETYYATNIPYTLTDNDVEVIDGVIQSCSFAFIYKFIIIPETLDGQTVTGIAGVDDYQDGVFYGKGEILSIELPSTMEYIGDWAFLYNDLTTLSLPDGLTYIGIGTFYGNKLDSVFIPNSVTLIDDGAFQNNFLTKVIFEEESTIEMIVSEAFKNNPDLSSIILPTHANQQFQKYKDGNENVYEPGDLITDFLISYETVFSNEISYYAVTFVDWDGSILKTESVIENGSATAPEEPSRDGYAFAGWDVSFDNITTDLTVTAQYSQDVTTYTVSFVDWNGTELHSETVAENGSATAPADPTREGYTFTGWDVTFDNITSDLTVTAQYSADATAYTVTFVDWDGSVLKTETVAENGSATAPANPTREGYTFTGWDVTFDDITSDLTVTAQYVVNSTTYFTVTFVDWDNSVLKTEAVVENETATAPDNPTRDGYTFSGWDVTFDNITSDLTVTAQYEVIIEKEMTYVPDDNFEQALIDLGYDTSPLNDSVPTENVKGLKSLDVKNRNISDLTGIEDFIALIHLSCSNNYLTSLDVSQNTALKELWFTYNQITNVNISNNSEIFELGCYNNQLKSLDISGITSLTNLYCWDNMLTSIDVSNNKELIHLRCDNNQLENLDISQNTKLKGLHCSGNQLTSLDVSNNTALLELYCDKNQLVSLDINQNTLLTNLNCAENQLTSLYISLNPNLTTIWCHTNRIESLDLSQSSKLTNLGCYSNRLVNLDVSNCLSLTQFRCNNNSLISLNLKNGNNIEISRLWVFQNPNLNCIEVDDPLAAESYNDWIKDATASYSDNCGAINHQVYFMDWDGTLLKIDTVIDGDAAIPPADPTREGYTFTGWDATLNNIISDLTITAQYAANYLNYTVTFIDWDGSVLKTQTVAESESATAPTDPFREGYTFTGWDTDFSSVSSNLTVTAQYQSNVYTLTDDDVVVVDGIIESCSYNFEIKNIIIPNMLDGQIITDIMGYLEYSDGVFSDKGITSIQLPSTLETIGDHAFYHNNIETLLIPNSVVGIGNMTFASNNLTRITIPSSVTTILGFTFSYNNLYYVEFEPNSNISFIGPKAFAYNPLLNFIILPTHANPYFISYKDESGSTHYPGNGITDFMISYEIIKAQTCNVSDSLALVALYNSTDGANWNIDWNLNSLVGTWNGITMEGNRVTEIILNNNNLIGTLPDEMADLTELKTLHLWDNNVSGTLQSLTNLTKLDYIVCDNNQFSGDLIPLSNKENMYWISFENNQLTGTLEPLMGLTMLRGIYLNGNQISGNIPTGIGALSQLERISLYQNQLTGPIPSTIGQLAKLEILHLNENNLEGQIPSEIGQLSSLSQLYLYSNQLTGSIPSEIGNLQNLIRFYADGNKLSGEIPASIGNLTNLQYLGLYQNSLSGSIPNEIGNLSNLYYLSLFENNLSGELPASIGTLESLGILSVRNNHFSGNIPSEIGSLPNLTALMIANNQYQHVNIEPILDWSNYSNLSNFVYAPQDTVGIEKTNLVTEGDDFTIAIDNYAPSNNDVYQWYKDGSEIAGATSLEYNISSATEGDLGTYYCVITNSITTELTLISNNSIVSLSSSPTYAVTFEDYDGAILKTETVEFGNAATAPESPERTGYTFMGWNVTFDNITADLMVTATYTINTYSVTFKDYDETILNNEIVEYGNAATSPVDPIREGYTFTGWDTDFRNITSDLTVTAQYTSTITTYAVTFVDWDGSILKTESVIENGSATAPEEPSRDGYAFAGWDLDFSNISQDITITALYVNSSTSQIIVKVKNGETWSPVNPNCDGDNDGVTVKLLDKQNPDQSNPLYSEVTNPNGYATFENIPFSEYIVYIERGTLTNLIESELVNEVTVGFVPYGVFRSQAEADGSGQAGAYVGGPVYRDYNGDGNFDVNDKEPGCKITVSAIPEYNYTCYMFSAITEGEFIISGYIYEDSTSSTKSVSILSESTEDRPPMQNVTVLLFENGKDEPIGVDSTNDQGYYEFNKLVAGNYELQVKLTDTNDSEKFEVELNDNLPEVAMNFVVNLGDGTITDVSIFNELDIKMYPNPSDGEVFLEFGQLMSKDIEVMVFSIDGAKVLQENYLSSNKICIDMSEHVSGMYFIKIISNDSEVVKKLILDKK